MGIVMDTLLVFGTIVGILIVLGLGFWVLVNRLCDKETTIRMDVVSVVGFLLYISFASAITINIVKIFK